MRKYHDYVNEQQILETAASYVIERGIDFDTFVELTMSDLPLDEGFWDGVGNFAGKVVGGVKQGWQNMKNAFNQAHDQAHPGVQPNSPAMMQISNVMAQLKQAMQQAGFDSNWLQAVDQFNQAMKAQAQQQPQQQPPQQAQTNGTMDVNKMAQAGQAQANMNTHGYNLPSMGGKKPWGT